MTEGEIKAASLGVKLIYVSTTGTAAIGSYGRSQVYINR